MLLENVAAASSNHSVTFQCSEFGLYTLVVLTLAIKPVAVVNFLTV